MTKDQVKKEAQHQLEKGNLIEAGWISNVLAAAPPEATPDELFVSHSSFFFGARYMLDTMVAMQSESVPQHVLEKVVDNLRKELDNFGKALEGEAAPGLH